MSKPIIEIQDLRKVYRLGDEKTVALNHINLAINEGEICCLLGTSGSGKSTLLNMMAGLEKPTQGRIVIDGSVVTEMNEKQLERERRAKEILEAVGLGKHMHHKPTQMSGGQQQRVGIARAFVNTPKIVFADEPTGNLDSHTTLEVMAIIVDIIRKTGQTLIIVTHDPSIMPTASSMCWTAILNILNKTKTPSGRRCRSWLTIRRKSPPENTGWIPVYSMRQGIPFSTKPCIAADWMNNYEKTDSTFP